MLLDDESSIAEFPDVTEPPKLFSNPFFKKQGNPGAIKRPMSEIPPLTFSRKSVNKPSIWESDREDSMKVVPVNLGGNSNARYQMNYTKPSVGYSNGSERGVVHYMSTLPTDKVMQYNSCRNCGLPFEQGPQLDEHQRTCIGVDSKLESIPPTEVDKITAHFDSVLESLFVTLHLYAANYLSRFSVGTCAVVEEALRYVIDSSSTNKLSEIARCVDGLQTAAKSIAASPNCQSPANRSAVVLLEATARAAGDKARFLDACPTRIKALLEKIKEVDLVTCSKLEELKLWKGKCSTFSSSSFKPSVGWSLYSR